MVTIGLSKEKIELLVDVIKSEIFSLEHKHQLNQWNMPPHLTLTKQERSEVRKRVSDLSSLINMLKTVEQHATPENNIL